MARVLIIGATSAIATATARLMAKRGGRLFLVARDTERLAALTADLNVRGGEVAGTAELDVLDSERHASVITEAWDALGGVDVALLAHGSLPDQKACETDAALARREVAVNADSTLSLMTLLAERFEQQRSGTLAVISSVAGDRGRGSNYVYGAAKAAVSTFAAGLRNRLAASGTSVLTIKPGFVDTPMTAAFPKGPLWASPETVARGILRAIDRRRDVVYLPWFWRWIMLIIRLIPEPVFKRMKL